MKDVSQTSFRLSRQAKDLLADLAAHDGLSMTAVLELLIRERARKIAAAKARTRPARGK